MVTISEFSITLNFAMNDEIFGVMAHIPESFAFFTHVQAFFLNAATVFLIYFFYPYYRQYNLPF